MSGGKITFCVDGFWRRARLAWSALNDAVIVVESSAVEVEKNKPEVHFIITPAGIQALRESKAGGE